MKMYFSRRHAGILGFLFWLGLAAVGAIMLRPSTAESTEDSLNPASQLVAYAFGRPTRVEAVSAEVPLRRGDPIFYSDAKLGWTQVGFIGRIDQQDEPRLAEVVWYHDEIHPRHCRFEAHYRRGTFEEIVETMLPDDKRRQIQQRLSEVFEEHGDEMVAAFQPVIEKSLRESASILEDALKASVEEHRDDFNAIGERWEDEILKQRIVPLIKKEVVPSIREHAEPVAKEIGRELWNRASLWRFGWRAIYDKSPLPERDLTKSEWERFVQEEAIPVFERHLDDILESQKRIFLDLSQNERIRDELENVFQEIASDKEFQALLKAVVRESVIENKRLHAVWTENFQSDEAKTAMRLAGKRLEPVVRQIGDELFGTRETGINPDFARVLRNQILGKDKRWITARPIADAQDDGGQESPSPPANGSSEPLVIHRADTRAQFPLIIMANDDALTAP